MCVYGVVRGRAKGGGWDKNHKVFRIVSKSTGLALSMNMRIFPVIQGRLVQLQGFS